MRERCYFLRRSVGLNNPSVLPSASHRLGGARRTPPRSGNFPTMGNFQARKWQRAHRALRKKALARPLHRGGYIEEGLASHRLGGARETPPRSGNAPNNGASPSSKAVKAPPRRGKAFWSAARFVCRMTLYACRSSSHKTRYAIFVGTLKDKKALSRPLHRRGS